MRKVQETGRCSAALFRSSSRMHRGEVVYPKNIEKQFSLTHPTVSGILQRLEAKGFITMLPDPADHRCRRVELTEKAEQCQQEISQHIREMEKRMDNIRYGKLDATDDECIHAAKLANAHDFITRLPDGYNTMHSSPNGICREAHY